MKGEVREMESLIKDGWVMVDEWMWDGLGRGDFETSCHMRKKERETEKSKTEQSRLKEERGKKEAATLHTSGCE